jgi:hypothetical protein
MDLNEMKNRLSAMQSKQSGKGGGEKKSIFWKPSVGKQIIRVVPSKYNKTIPFTEMYFHYGIGKRTIISPSNFGEKDPIIEFAKELRKTKEPENWKLAKKLEPKMRVFAPVIVRGEEDKGVRLWEFGKEIYQSLLSLAADEDIGDFTDVMEGRDMKVETVGPETTGTDYNKSRIMPALKTSQLCNDNDELTKWLETQPDPTSFSKKYTFDEIKQFLAEWLNPEEEAKEEGGIMDGPATDFDSPAPVESKFELDTKPKANKAFAPKKEIPTADEFEDLFADN